MWESIACRRLVRVAGKTIVLLFALGCSSGQAPATYLLEEAAYCALQQTWEPLVPSAETRSAISSGALKVTDVERFAEAGLGVRSAPGRSWIEHAELAPGFVPGAPEARRSIVYFWQAADPQIIDEESPIRFEPFDLLYRPHGLLTTQVFEAHVRTARRLANLSGRPFDFALIAGDLTDGSQQNELDWMIKILNGGVIDPDSGIDDDPVPGPGNDHSDPFVSGGMSIPWYAVLGNHETLYNGGFGQLTDEIRTAAGGGTVEMLSIFPNGFCDGATVNGAVRSSGPTPKDARRLPLRRAEVLSTLLGAAGEPIGHGLAADDVAAGRGYFSAHPLPGKPLVLLGLNTVNSQPSGIGVGAQGWMDREQFAWLGQQLSSADAAHELVIVMSHHRVADFASTSPVSGAEVADLLARSEGVVLHLVGHGHNNDGASYGDSAVNGYWELMLASTVDFPMQSRILEIVDEANGFLSIYATNLDHNSPVGSLAHRGRELAAAKLAFGSITPKPEVQQYWQQDSVWQNLLLRVAIPSAVRARLGATVFPSRIESEVTLQTL